MTANPVSNTLCVTRELIDRHALERPDKIFACFDDGAQWTYLELQARVRSAAAGLQKLGVRQYEPVLLWLPNGPRALAVYFALNYLGAVAVPINTAYRGKLLEHVIAKTGARLMIAHGGLVERLSGIATPNLQTLVTVGNLDVPIAGLTHINEDVAFSAVGTPSAPDRPIEPWDTHLVLFTSGTTGPSKGVLVSYLHSYATNTGFRHQTPDDRHLVTLPLFHTAGAVTCYMALAQGASIALVDGFDTKAFWQTADRFEVTTTGLLGAMIQYLTKQPPSPDDRTHTLKKSLVAPMDQVALDFSERFGVDVYNVYNMTELSVPMLAGPNPKLTIGCGRIRTGVEVRLVDEHDFDVPPGQIGELILRADSPWSMLSGYLNDPEATARAWRNGWFHTGDAFRQDTDDNFFFVDRMKDSVRRRGENISSFEVESEILSHPAVREVAVIGVRATQSEDEVMAVVSPVPGLSVDPAELIAYLRPRLAHFMIPRYIRFLAELPKTPTQKVQKHLLRADGVTADTWDRERAGITIKRERLKGLGQ